MGSAVFRRDPYIVSLQAICARLTRPPSWRAGTEQNSAAGSGSFPPHGQYLLTLTLKSGKEVRIPRESLPPPLNQGDIPPTFWECIAALSSEDEGLALDELWRHYQKVTVDWTTQAALLRETTALPLTPQTDLPINGQPQTKR